MPPKAQGRHTTTQVAREQQGLRWKSASTPDRQRARKKTKQRQNRQRRQAATGSTHDRPKAAPPTPPEGPRTGPRTGRPVHGTARHGSESLSEAQQEEETSPSELRSPTPAVATSDEAQEGEHNTKSNWSTSRPLHYTRGKRGAPCGVPRSLNPTT